MMRIRKRAVPLPVSLLSPVRLLQLSADSPLPADDLLIGAASVSPVPIQLKGYRTEKKKEKREDNNESSMQNDTGGVSDNGGVHPPATPWNLTATEGCRWCEGDKAIPLKKRKVRLELEMCEIGASSTCKKMKSKTNKKCTLDHHDNSTSDSDYDNEDEKSKKKKKKGKTWTRNTLGGKYSIGRSSKEGRIKMEGRRCSRVNGRGWRCMQATLVGYSLCEHHLGKGGRLMMMRSIGAAPSNSHENTTSTTTTTSAPPAASSTPPRPSSEQKTRCSNDHQAAAATGGKKKKKRRVGVVKARSLSSLLCQPHTKQVRGAPTPPHPCMHEM